jgi:hypothetical protein
VLALAIFLDHEGAFGGAAKGRLQEGQAATVFGKRGAEVPALKFTPAGELKPASLAAGTRVSVFKDLRFGGAERQVTVLVVRGEKDVSMYRIERRYLRLDD